jgi:hypothetical protein|nr:MAG TPA: Lower collar protein [Caudoviricetes sp.]
MSVYTTQVRFICEAEAGLKKSVGYDDVNTVIQNAIPKIFNFSWPIFDESYRNVLETKILKHYYTREIGLETYGLWKLKLDTKLNEIMPYYNQLYKSALLEFNPLYDVDITRNHTGKKTGTEALKGNVDINGQVLVDNHGNVNTTDDTTVANTTTSENIDKFSATPQGAIDNLRNEKYLTNARMVNDTNTSNGTTTGKTDTSTDSTTDTTTNTTTTTNNSTTINNTEDYLETVKGKQGTQSYASLIMEFRETFLNIDMMVIEDLGELFMNIWTGGYPF